jgi:hypothetical protein
LKSWVYATLAECNGSIFKYMIMLTVATGEPVAQRPRVVNLEPLTTAAAVT